MQSCFSSAQSEALPICCTISILQENRLIAGIIWGFYPHHCQVETEYPLIPGMTVSLTMRVSQERRHRFGWPWEG